MSKTTTVWAQRCSVHKDPWSYHLQYTPEQVTQYCTPETYLRTDRAMNLFTKIVGTCIVLLVMAFFVWVFVGF